MSWCYYIVSLFSKVLATMVSSDFLLICFARLSSLSFYFFPASMILNSFPLPTVWILQVMVIGFFHFIFSILIALFSFPCQSFSSSHARALLWSIMFCQAYFFTLWSLFACISSSHCNVIPRAHLIFIIPNIPMHLSPGAISVFLLCLVLWKSS